MYKKRSEKPEVRDATFSEIKERIKETKDEKKAKKVEAMANKSQTSQGKRNLPKGAGPMGPKAGGSRAKGKR